MKPMEILHDDVHEYWTPDCSEPKLILEPRKIPEEGFWDRGSDLLEVMEELKMSIQYDIQFKGWKLADVSETVFYCTMVQGLVKGGFGLQLESRDMADWGDGLERSDSRDMMDGMYGRSYKRRQFFVLSKGSCQFW